MPTRSTSSRGSKKSRPSPSSTENFLLSPTCAISSISCAPAKRASAAKPRSTGESVEKINAMVVGFGHLGNFHAQKYCALESEGVKLVAVVDPRGEELRAKADKVLPGLPIFASVEHYAEAVKAGRQPAAKVASVATTTDHHVSVGLKLIEMGVHL